MDKNVARQFIAVVVAMLIFRAPGRVVVPFSLGSIVPGSSGVKAMSTV
jgi:hypothetical protein